MSTSPSHSPTDREPAAGSHPRSDLLRGARSALRGPVGVLAAILLVDAAVFGLGVLTEVTGRNTVYFDLEEEQNLPSWVSTLQLAGVALTAGIYALLSTRRVRLGMGALALIFAFLSLDEFVEIHEEVIQRVTNSSTADPWYWPVFYSPLLLVLMASAAVFVVEHRRLFGSVVAPVAALALLVAPIVLDSVATQLKGLPVLLTISVTLEEALELCGGAFLVFVLLRMVSARVTWERAATLDARKGSSEGRDPARGA